MKEIFLIDGNKIYNSNDLIKLYGSEENVILNIYNWEKNRLIKINKDDKYERIN